MAWLHRARPDGARDRTAPRRFITTHFDWRWIFWINIPIAVLGLVLVTRFIPDIRGEASRAFDTRGFLLLGPGPFQLPDPALRCSGTGLLRLGLSRA